MFRLIEAVLLILLGVFSSLPPSLPATTITVDCEGGGEHLTIQGGISAAVDGDTVLVSPCRYIENINYFGREIVVRSLQGPLVTTIKGTSQYSNVVVFGSNLGQEPDSTAVLEGFHIVGGHDCIHLGPRHHPKIVGNILSNAVHGVYTFNNSRPIIRNNVFFECQTGIRIGSNVREVSGNIFHRLWVSGWALYVTGCGDTCLVEGNWILGADDSPSGTQTGINVLGEDKQPMIRNNVIIGDYWTVYPMWKGIQSIMGASPEIYSNSVSGFSQYGFVSGSGWPVLVNNTITRNGAGLHFNLGGSPTVINNVVVENDTLDYGMNCLDVTGEVIDYNDVWGNTFGDYSPECAPGPGSISLDPLFVDADRGHLSLQSCPLVNAMVGRLPCSPAIDAGDPSISDPDGTRSDMGVFGGPEAQPVNLTLYSISGFNLSGGDTLRMGTIVSNNTQVLQDVTLEIDLYIATGYPYGRNPITGPLPLSLSPGETVTPYPEFDYRVPVNLSSGLYRLVGVVKDDAGEKVDEEFLVYMVD